MPFKVPAYGQPVPETYTRLLDRLDREAFALDSRFRIPLTRVRFGWDPLVGLVPIAGDIVMAVYGLRIIGMARELGADGPLLRRMVLNLTVDTLLGAVPIIGPLFDIYFRSNLRNVQLLTDEIRRQRTPPITDGG
ncbi:MAG: DUF4112 domain-containing protein [Hyphomicrobium sp.]|nr:DUF4112 domain-containing protein [Hyphomicrobium sp.]